MPTQQTHHLTFDDDRVTKRYVSWDREEPRREWIALGLLAQHAPDLAPTPLRRGEDPPTLTMTRLPGLALIAPLTAAQTDDAARARRRLHEVPPDALRASGIGPRVWPPATFHDVLRGWLAPGATHPDPVVRRALDAARDHLARPLDLPGAAHPVLGQADGNLANLVHDGTTCRLVDLEDAGESEAAFEAADLLEHVAVRLHRAADADRLRDGLLAGLDDDQAGRCAAYQRDFAVSWLTMLLPGGPAGHRNPPGSLADQARHVLGLLG